MITLVAVESAAGVACATAADAREIAAYDAVSRAEAKALGAVDDARPTRELWAEIKGKSELENTDEKLERKDIS